MSALVATLAACAPAADEPIAGGSLTIAVPDGVPSAYNLGSTYPTTNFTAYLMAWPLFLASEEDFDIAPGIATEYEASSDGLTHTIGLREGMTFHDGSPIDAPAVVAVLESYFFEDSPLRDEGAYSLVGAAFGNPVAIDSVIAVDDRTVKITLTSPRVDIRDPLFQMPIMNPAIISDPAYGTSVELLRDAGSGPFRVTNFAPDEFVELERYEDFFEPVSLDRVRIELQPDPAARALALESGSVDIALELTAEDQARLTSTGRFQTHASKPANNVFLRFFPAHSAEMQDPRVREAIWLAMDRQSYRAAFLNPAAAEDSTQPVVVPGVAGYNDDIEYRDYDPDRARELLDEAGVETLDIKTLTRATSGPILALGKMQEAIAADLKKVGINVEITEVDTATFFAERYNYDFEVGWYGDTYNSDFVFRLFYRGAPDPWTPPYALGDPGVQALVEGATISADQDERIAAWEELQRLNHDEYFIGVPIAAVGNSAVASTRVHDFSLAWNNRAAIAWLHKRTTVEAIGQ
ncbi:ABC transporter substrate-binding protein [Agromyces bauzanensis]